MPCAATVSSHRYPTLPNLRLFQPMPTLRVVFYTTFHTCVRVALHPMLCHLQDQENYQATESICRVHHPTWARWEHNRPRHTQGQGVDYDLDTVVRSRFRQIWDRVERFLHRFLGQRCLCRDRNPHGPSFRVCRIFLPSRVRRGRGWCGRRRYERGHYSGMPFSTESGMWRSNQESFDYGSASRRLLAFVEREDELEPGEMPALWSGLSS